MKEFIAGLVLTLVIGGIGDRHRNAGTGGGEVHQCRLQLKCFWQESPAA